MSDNISLARKHRETLVDKCVKHLFAAAGGLSSSLSFSKIEDSNSPIESKFPNGASLTQFTETKADALMFKRCLEMLKYFMDYFDTKYMSSKTGQMLVRRHGMLNDDKM